MQRRSFFGTLCGLLAMPFGKRNKPPERNDYPWDARAVELFATDGFYCSYAAWQEWAETNWLSGIEDWEARDGLDMVDLYVLCCRAIDESRKSSPPPCERT